MPDIRCANYDALFYRQSDESWKRLCLRCFVRKKRGEDDDDVYEFHSTNPFSGRAPPPPPPPPPAPVATFDAVTCCVG